MRKMICCLQVTTVTYRTIDSRYLETPGSPGSKGRFMKKLWISFAVVLVVSFSVLGWIGTRIYQEMPPLPARIVDTNGAVVVADGDIGRGQNVWQALGGMEVGSIWGHGSYVAPDWTADWLHRESSFVLD